MSLYEKGVTDGRISEAEIFLDNLIALKNELDVVGYDSKQSYINALITDLEVFLNSG